LLSAFSGQHTIVGSATSLADPRFSRRLAALGRQRDQNSSQSFCAAATEAFLLLKLDVKRWVKARAGDATGREASVTEPSDACMGRRLC
jgi:hypothetical protein